MAPRVTCMATEPKKVLMMGRHNQAVDATRVMASACRWDAVHRGVLG